ncbi:hypothetical protein EVAR_82993_1 [Eumeta japonica]|uniref:Uncharacterized protein n=1 Tax=Eumeta variegata TaxID=151549 RepID=A0A4C1VQT2_EUMVA|nr:hypothetical protein EVAR_82993_1 [Eumeta japonica]
MVIGINSTKLPKLPALDPSSCDDALSQAMLSVADMLPLKKHFVVDILSPPWWEQECTRAVEERRGAEILYCRNMFRENTYLRKILSIFLRYVPNPGGFFAERS